MKRNLLQFIKFGIVGVSNTLVSYLINLLCLFVLDKYHVACDYVIANTVAFVLSVLWSFYWNERFVFTKQNEDYKSNKFVRLLKMYLSYGFTGIILNNVFIIPVDFGAWHFEGDCPAHQFGDWGTNQLCD